MNKFTYPLSSFVAYPICMIAETITCVVSVLSNMSEVVYFHVSYEVAKFPPKIFFFVTAVFSLRGISSTTCMVLLLKSDGH